MKLHTFSLRKQHFYASCFEVDFSLENKPPNAPIPAIVKPADHQKPLYVSEIYFLAHKNGLSQLKRYTKTKMSYIPKAQKVSFAVKIMPKIQIVMFYGSQFKWTLTLKYHTLLL